MDLLLETTPDTFTKTTVYQTGAVYMIDGQIHGIHSRVSPHLVSNIGQVGAAQPVLLVE